MPFADIPGDATARLAEYFRNAIRAGRLHHAFLFCGPRGVGKQAFAFAVVKALCCTSATVDFCGACRSCRLVDSGNHADVWSLARAENKRDIPIDDVREMIRRLAVAPIEGAVRALVIEEAERLNHYAQNCLLKTLEEPPAGTHIFLLSANPSGLTDTIRSRSQRIHFAPLAPDKLAQILAERYNMECGAARSLARLAGGSLGLALEYAQADASGMARAVADSFALLGRGETGALEKILADPLKGDLKAEERRTALAMRIELVSLVLGDLLRLMWIEDESVLRCPGASGALGALRPHLKSEQVEETIRLAADARANLAANVNPKLIVSSLVEDLGFILGEPAIGSP